MEKIYIEDKTFDHQDFTETTLLTGEYENCTFSNCNFSNLNLSHFAFSDCTFTGCNLSLARITKTAFKEVIFRDCKLLGLHFNECHEFLFTATFDGCILNLSSFYNRKIKKAGFSNSSMQEVDFTGCDLSHASFDNCDLANAIFDNSILEKADFRTAYNYVIDPGKNKIKKARFSLPGVTGLLDHLDIEIS